MKAFVIGFFTCGFFLSGCGYNFGAVKRNIPGAYDRVSVPVFKNNTSEVGLEAYFTKSMIEEVERGHIASIVPRDEAQVVVEGEIKSVQYLQGALLDKKTLSSMPDDTVLSKEYRIVVDTYIQVRRRSDQKVIWNGTFKGERRYPAPQVTKAQENSVNALYNHSSRQQGIEVMAKDMMAEAYSNMTENF